MYNPFGGNKFPYSNFHELNLDWIIEIAKNFLDQYTHIQETIETGLEDLETLKNNLEAALQAWYDEHSEDIANQLASALSDLNDWYTEHENYLDDTLQENITAFNTAAEAKAAQTIATIPDDYTELANKVTHNYENIDKAFDAVEMLSGEPVVYHWDWVPDEYVITNNGTFAEYEGWHRSGYVALEGAKALAITTDATASFRNNAFYDSSKTYITDFNISNSLVLVPANAAYFVVSHDNDTKIDIRNADTVGLGSYLRAGNFNNFSGSTIVDFIKEFYVSYTASQTGYYVKVKDLNLEQNTEYTLNISQYENVPNNVLMIVYFYDSNSAVVGSYEVSKEQPIFTFTSPRSFASCDLWAAPVGSTAAGQAGIATYRGLIISKGNSAISGNYCSRFYNVPRYFDYTLGVKVAAINSRLPYHGDNMIVISDYHAKYNANHSPDIINWLNENTPIKKVFNLGDTINQAEDANTMIKELSKFRHLFTTDQYYATCGNHEWYTNLIHTENAIPTEGQLYNALVKEHENIIKGRSLNCSYYFDNEIEKIRYIVLGCNYNSDLEVTQVNWCVSVINNTPTDYTIVMLSHTGLTFADTTPIGSFTNIVTALGNFAGKVAGVFVGHQHKEGTYTSGNGIHFIQLNCDSYAQQEGDISRKLGNYTEQSFYCIQINTDTSTVNVENIGAGTSLSYTY